MKIIFVSQYFYPEEFKGNEIVFDLAGRGHDVTVLTGTPNYPYGKFFDGFSFFKNCDEIVNGVRVYRSRLFPRGNNLVTLFLNYISFPFFSYFKLNAIKDEFDIVVVQQLSPVFMVLPALWIKKRQSIPLVSWVLDLWPESLEATTPIKGGIVIRLLNKFVKKFYKNSDLILISSKFFEKNIVDKDVKLKDKLVYFPNWAEDSIALNDGDSCGIQVEFPTGFNVMFAGNIGDAQDFENILNAAELSINDSINWIIVGDGRKQAWVKEQIEKRGLTNVFIFGRYPINSMPYLFSKANAMLVSLKDEKIYEMTVPAKIQAYMSRGKIIFGMLNGEGRGLINDNKIGVCVASGDYQRLVDEIRLFKTHSPETIRDMERASLYVYQKFFNKQNLLDHFELLLKKIVK